MGEVSLSKALAVVDKVADTVERYGWGWSEVAGRMRGTFCGAGANDGVEVQKNNTSEFAVKYTVGLGLNRKERLMGFEYWGAVTDLTGSGGSKIRLNLNDIHNELEQNSGMPRSLTAVFYVFLEALGFQRPTKRGAFIESLGVYTRCLRDSPSFDHCEKERSAFLEKVESAELDRRVGQIREIWEKVDKFLQEARKLDDNDSDLDVLIKIVAQYIWARPAAMPKTIPDALEVVKVCQKFLSEFEASPSLKAFVMEEGECYSVNYVPNKSRSCSGTYDLVCTVADYTFKEKVNYKCPENYYK